MAFYTYSKEKYEPCVFDNGTWEGAPEVLVGSEAVGIALDLDDDGMVQETIEEASSTARVASATAVFQVSSSS